MTMIVDKTFFRKNFKCLREDLFVCDVTSAQKHKLLCFEVVTLIIGTDVIVNGTDSLVVRKLHKWNT